MMIDEIRITTEGDQIDQYIRAFAEATILVLGDIILDEFIWGEVTRISPEAPVPVVAVQRETTRLGGAANVVNNIVSLEGKSLLCGLIGDDAPGRELLGSIEALGQPTDGIIVDPNRPTSIKTRIIAHNQQVVRYDKEKKRKIGEAYVRLLLDFIGTHKDRIDAVVVADYGKGVITAEMMIGLRDLMNESGHIIAVDPKTDNFEYYQGMDIITPNHHEAGAYCGKEIVDSATLLECGNEMLTKLQCGAILITQGKDGMTLFEGDGTVSHIPTVARKVFDVTGAGDTVISALALGLAVGMDLKTAALLSNVAAGIVVGEVGTSTVKAAELQRVIHGHSPFSLE
jgi:D-beta-D-heptose 7-phosphate kinase/D-beta-D-heptose 1-phosphate adenosyltransferase